MSRPDNLPLKQYIIQQSEQLFRKNGYDKTGMRQIADACGISVGNLCYHFPKKEDLVMAHHNILLDAFMDYAVPQLEKEDNWTKFFAAEYEFTLRITKDTEIFHMFKEVVNVSSLRRQYYAKRAELFSCFLDPKELPCTEYDFQVAIMALCALELTFLDVNEDASEKTLRNCAKQAFRTFLLFVRLDPDSKEEEINRAFVLGHENFSRYSNPDLIY